MADSKRILMIDCQYSGISGDKAIAALLNLGANTRKVTAAMEASKDYVQDCDWIRVRIGKVRRSGFNATLVQVDAKDQAQERSGKEVINATIACAKDLSLSHAGLEFSKRTVRTLVNIETRLHGKPSGDIHLHETGGIDTIADVVGAATALDDMKLWSNTSIYTSPVAVGGGLIKFSHGITSSPAFATLEILKSRGFTILGGPVQSELTTPTGASILVNLASACHIFYPTIRPISIGYGAGVMKIDQIPNILRLVLGEDAKPMMTDEVLILETNLDDATGETVGYTMERLIESGAQDVSVIPMFTKKNRPAHMLRIIVNRDNMERISAVLFKETGTLGIRILPCQRYIMNRRVVAIDLEVNDIKGRVRAKVSKDQYGIITRIKPEYDDIALLARRLDLPFRRVLDEFHKKMRLESNST